MGRSKKKAREQQTANNKAEKAASQPQKFKKQNQKNKWCPPTPESESNSNVEEIGATDTVHGECQNQHVDSTVSSTACDSSGDPGKTRLDNEIGGEEVALRSILCDKLVGIIQAEYIAQKGGRFTALVVRFGPGSKSMKYASIFLLSIHSGLSAFSTGNSEIHLPPMLDQRCVLATLDYLHGYAMPRPPISEYQNLLLVALYFKITALENILSSQMPPAQFEYVKRYAKSLPAPKSS